MSSTNASATRTLELSRATPLTDLQLPARPFNSLRRRGITTVGQLIAWSAEDLLFEVQGLGTGGIDEIKAALERQNLSLATTTNGSTYGIYAKSTARHVKNHNVWQQPTNI
ncbi:DNA-directed RNA polymerase subunit alpha C-terminal domain-containing protein [Paenarthrobacter histidinolovorans]|uniref:DNA-directed RNA polymerase alpha subunit n=1 Tax=Paenarthrobacter histidinolovorans TaxID=43664 RepID=A0ABW8N0M5_9MICC